MASHVVHQHAMRRSGEPVPVDIAEVFNELQVVPADDPAARADGSQGIEELERLLEQLPPRVGAALVLHRIAGYTVQEIADEFGVARETAKKYLARAVEHCRNSRAAARAGGRQGAS